MSLKPTRLPPFDPPMQATLAPGHEEDDTNSEGPSWGLIIPIIMIGAFLACVVLCLWWHKWRDRRMRLTKDTGSSGSSFHRSYRGSRKSRGSYDITRDSMRSTTPLRSSLNEKHRVTHPQTKAINVNVMPIQQRPNNGKYSFYWDRNHWKAVPTPISRTSAKPLSPINEIDSPLSAKLSELSRTYDPVGTQSYSPYHLAWMTSSNAPPSYEESERGSYRGVRLQVQVQRPGNYSPNMQPANDQLTKSPFFPNNNTPTTECDTESESSQHDQYQNSRPVSQDPSYISCPTSNSMFSRSNPLPSRDHSTDQTGTSFTSSYHESSYQISSKQSQSALMQQSSSLYTNQSTTDHYSTNLSSLPSSIAPFSKQNCQNDLNNNSSMMPNANITYPRTKVLNYTLASSVSSDTHISDNTSMLPNVGSNNNSTYPIGMNFRSRQPSAEPSGPGSPEDLSKLVDEMSSIRPADESSSLRPNYSVDPTPRITTISGTSLSIGMHRSWSVQGDMGNMSSLNTTNSSSQVNSQEGSMYWDNYPLTAGARAQSKSFQELPLHVYENHSFLGNIPEMNYYVPILKDQQYWV